MAKRVLTAEDTFESVADEHNVSVQDLYNDNRKELDDAAQARGFSSGVHYHEFNDDKTGERVSEVKYRVFAGETVNVPDKKSSAKAEDKK